MSDLHFPADFQENCLWKDPLRLPGGVIRAENIEAYVSKHNLLIDKQDFQPHRLKGASYSMSPRRNEGWFINDYGCLERLNQGTDPQLGDYYIVPSNGLVFIGLHEYLRLPFYIIGRHNLKIRYVYQGLLLGTGPQVDPGYMGRLYIPLHNFTRQDVKIFIDDSFVSIDFTHTTALELDKDPATYEEFYSLYSKTLRLIDKPKVYERVTLASYLEGHRPSSSLSDLVPKLEDSVHQFIKRKIIDVVVVLAIITIVGTFLAVIVALWLPLDQLLEGINNQPNSSAAELARLSEEVKQANKDLYQARQDTALLKKDVDTLKATDEKKSAPPK